MSVLTTVAIIAVCIAVIVIVILLVRPKSPQQQSPPQTTAPPQPASGLDLLEEIISKELIEEAKVARQDLAQAAAELSLARVQYNAFRKREEAEALRRRMTGGQQGQR